MTVAAELAEVVDLKLKNWKRAAVVLRHREGHSIRRAALELGVSWRAAKTWVQEFGAVADVAALLAERRGRKPRQLKWRPEELEALRHFSRTRSHRARETQLRNLALVALAMAHDASNRDIGRFVRPRWSPQRVARWRARFLAERLACIPAKWRGG